MSKLVKPIQEGSTCPVPRSFILLDSLKRANQFTNVTYGIIPDDEKEYKDNNSKLENWTGTIIYDDGKNLNVIELFMKVPFEFPTVPPVITFAQHSLDIEKVKKICNDDGTIQSKYLSQIKWDNKMGLGEYLMEVYNKLRSKY